MHNDAFYPEFMSRIHALCRMVPGFREVFETMLERFELNPKEYLFRRGQLLTHHFWQMSGYSLGYLPDESGHRKVMRVMEKGNWLMTCLEPKLGLRIDYNLVILAPSVFYGISYANLKVLCNQFLEANFMWMEFQRQEIDYRREREWILSTWKRQVKIDFFQTKYSSGLCHTITQEDRASYLDMTR